jgi:hypothetical protein
MGPVASAGSQAPADSRAERSARFALLTSNPNFTRLWAGEALSELGSQVTTIAMPLLVLATTHSAADASFVAAARSVATALAVVPAGLLADRLQRRLLMIGCAAGRALAIGAVPVALALGGAPLALLLAVSLLDAGLFSVSYVAERSMLPQLVAPEQLSDAVTANEARAAAATLGGPPVGGALFGLARAAPFLADVLSFAVAIASLSRLRAPARETTGAPRRQAAREVAQGFRWLFGQPFLRSGSLLYAAENVTLSAVQLLALLLLHHHGVSSAAIGAAFAIVGGGGLLSAVIASPLRRRLSPRLAILLEPWTYVAMIPLLLVLHTVIGVGLTVACMLVPMTLSTSIIVGARLTLTPDHLRGRVQASGAFTAVSLTWLGPLAVGLLVQDAGYTTTILVVTGWALATALVASATPAFRTMPLAPARDALDPQEDR